MNTLNCYISTGETGAFFTLRVLEECFDRKGFKYFTSHHICNLSQSGAEAIEKAKVHAGKIGLQLQGVNDGDLQEQLREIKRASAEEIAQREAKLEADRLKEEELRQYFFERDANEIRETHEINFGYNKHKAIESMDRGWLTWVANAELDGLMGVVREVVLEHYSHLLLPVPNGTLTIGEPKQRSQFHVTVLNVASFDRQDFSGYGMERVYITTLLDHATEAALVCFSAAFKPEVGEELDIKATVKDHKQYKGQWQTIVQRVSIVEEKS